MNKFDNPETRKTVIQMLALGKSQDEVSGAVGCHRTWVSRFASQEQIRTFIEQERNKLVDLLPDALSAVIQDALRITRKERLKKEFCQIQGYWSRKAKEKGVLTEKDLEKYLKK